MSAYTFDDEPHRAGRPNGHAAGAIEWPEPIDILADPLLTGIATVDADCLPASMLALAVAEGARLQVDPCHIAALTIGTTSAVVSDDWRVRLKVNDRGWIQHPSIWTAVVAESGQKKTDSLRAATRGISKVEQKLREAHSKEMAKHLKELAEWEGKDKKERGTKPTAPAAARIATDDFTIEVLSDLLQTSHKLLLRSDELATMLGASERYQKGGSINPNRAHMLALYDGGVRQIDRVQRGNMYVRNWSAVSVGHVQPAKVRQLVSSLSDDGLLQRFMIVMPARVESRDPDDDDIISDRHAVDQYARIVEILYAMQPPNTLGDGGKVEHDLVEAGGDAHDIRRRLFRLVERIEADPILPAPLREAASKWRGTLARLALVFHCVELAEMRLAGQRPDPSTMTTLKASTVEKACNFIMRIVVPSTIRFHTEIGSSGPCETHARWIANYLLSRKLESVTLWSVGRAYREIRGDRRAILAAMDLLEVVGWVTPPPDKPRGTGWLVNPRVHVVFAAQAAAEKVRRDAVRARLKVSIAELCDHKRTRHRARF